MCLILFHGQSEVERGFSVNKQLLVENLKPKSLVALQRTEDHTNVLELSHENIKIFNELIKSVKEAHHRHQDQLEKQKNKAQVTKISEA